MVEVNFSMSGWFIVVYPSIMGKCCPAHNPEEGYLGECDAWDLQTEVLSTKSTLRCPRNIKNKVFI